MSPLTSPPPPAHLASFPQYQLQPTQPLFRIHPAIYGPWWFGSTGASRFDLRLPNGTCYLAEDALGAFVEAFQAWMGAAIPMAEIVARSMSTVHVPRLMILADCTVSKAHAFGITGDIHSAASRRRTRAWASAFRRAGFDGVRYLVRHDPAQRQAGIALFGPAGATAWPVDVTEAIGNDLLHRAEDIFGIRVRR